MTNPISDPLHNPGPTPTPGVTPPGSQDPMKGSDMEAIPKFTLPPEPLPGQPSVVAEQRPSPLELAKQMEEEGKSARWTPQEMQDRLTLLQTHLQTVSTQLESPKATGKLTPEHFNALNQIVDKMNPDMRSMAKYAGVDFAPVTQKKGEGVLSYLLNWVSGTQQMTNNSLSALAGATKPDPAEMLKLQFIAQRSLERTELMSSVISSSVSGIKTLMSMQLG